MTNEGLCIGGPLDGQWKADDHNWFEVTIMPRLPSGSFYAPSHERTAQVRVKTAVYHARPLWGKTFWVAEGELDTPEALLARLIRGYRGIAPV